MLSNASPPLNYASKTKVVPKGSHDFHFSKNSPKEAFTAIWIALKRIGEKERNYFDEMSPKRLKTKSVTHPASLALCLD